MCSLGSAMRHFAVQGSVGSIASAAASWGPSFSHRTIEAASYSSFEVSSFSGGEVTAILPPPRSAPGPCLECDRNFKESRILGY